MHCLLGVCLLIFSAYIYVVVLLVIVHVMNNKSVGSELGIYLNLEQKYNIILASGRTKYRKVYPRGVQRFSEKLILVSI